MKYFALSLIVFTLSCGTAPTAGTAQNSKTALSPSAMKDTISKTPEQYRVLREKGTERPYSGEYEKNFAPGTYVCAACGNVLFYSDHKFDAGCGWPSFYREAAKGHIIEQTDLSLGMRRTEIMCAKCGGHLGHVFDDGPKETGLRYCVNSVSIKFIPKDSVKAVH